VTAAGLPDSAKSARDAYQAVLAEGWHSSPAEAERFSTDTAVPANAAQAFPVEESIRVLRRLRMLGPSNPVWTVNLTSVYARAVRDVFDASNPMRQALGGPVRYRDMWQMRLRFAGPELARS